MRSVIVDTNVLIDFLERANAKIAEQLATVDEIVLTPVVIGEYLAGIRGGNNGDRLRARFDDFVDDVSVRVLWMTKVTGRRYAEIYQELKAKGKPIPPNDIWIAASAKEHDLELLTGDDHFGEISGLRLVRQLRQVGRTE